MILLLNLKNAAGFFTVFTVKPQPVVVVDGVCWWDGAGKGGEWRDYGFVKQCVLNLVIMH